VDYVNGVLTEKGRKEVVRVEEAILRGDIDYKDFIWVECLKDELRPLEKVDKPRSFRCCTVIMQYITKRIFGNMVVHIVKNRDKNGICVGINPLKDFGKIHEKMNAKKKTWGLDFKKWDGGMLPQMQHAISDVILEFIHCDRDRKIAEFILHNMAHSLVLVLDDLFQMNHSMPSGSFLTAILNSMVNKMLTACYYFDNCRKLNMKPSLKQCIDELLDWLYGDDRNNATSLEGFGALSMAKYFASLGLEVTDDQKRPVTMDSVPLDEITFLKRNYKYDVRFHKIVCPLARSTILSSLSWYDRSKDMEVVMNGKLDAFQREAYLHEDYEILMHQLRDGLEDRKISHTFREESELYEMVMMDDINYLDFYSNNEKYV
jgi:hypothetical protein